MDQNAAYLLTGSKVIDKERQGTQLESVYFPFGIY